MRIVDPRLFVGALALLAVACGPHRHDGGHRGTHREGHHHQMAKGCGPEGCAYRNRCFSDGAVSTNAGVCQQCTQGRWVSASGCRDGGWHTGEKPCDHHGHMDGKSCDHRGHMDGKPCDHRGHRGHKGKHRRHTESERRS